MGKMNPYNRLLPGKRPGCDTPLAAWLEAHGVTRYELAKKIGCDPKVLTRWADGKTEIGLIYAFLVERATGGGVPVASWLGTDLFKIRMRDLGCDWSSWMEKKADGCREWRRKRKTA